MREFPRTIKAAIFDFDGTICDTESANSRYVQSIMRSYGIELDEDELLSFVGGDDCVIVPPILERWGVAQTLDDYLADIARTSRIYRADPLEPFEGFYGFIRLLKERGMLCAVASSTAACDILFALNRLRLVSSFDAVVCREMVETLKPSPEPYLKTLELLGVEAGECVVFEDSSFGISAAQAAGIYTVAFTGSAIVQDVSAADASVGTWAEACSLF